MNTFVYEFEVEFLSQEFYDRTDNGIVFEKRLSCALEVNELLAYHV